MHGACWQGNGDSQQPSSMPGGHSMPVAQSMQAIHGMTHLSRGLLAGLQHPHIPSLDASQPYQHQPGLSLPVPQGAELHPYSSMPRPGPYNLTGRPPMVRFLPRAVQSPHAYA